jgi:hypothetical protein
VATNDPRQPHFNLSLRMVINTPGAAPSHRIGAFARVGPFLVSPSPRWSASIPRGNSVEAVFDIYNHGEPPVRITKATPGGEAFSVKLDTIQEGKRYMLTAKSAASLPMGRHAQVVKLATDSNESPELGLELELFVISPVSVSPETISFGTLPLSQGEYNVSTLTRFVWIRQPRGAALEIKGVSSTLPFVQVQVEPEVAGRSFMLKVGLEREKLARGEHRGKIKVQTNNPDAPVLEIQVLLNVQ